MSSPRARRGSDIARIVLTIREKKARLKELEREARELRSQLTAARDGVGGPPIRGRRSGATRGTPRPVWPSSIAGRAATALRQAGRPLRIEELLRAIERISGDKIAQATLVGQLARDVRKGRLFRRTAPNVFALAEGTSRRRGR